MTLSRSAFAEKLRDYPEIVLTDDDAATHRGTWRSFFRDRIGSRFDDQVIFEIGCADADFLSRLAAKRPQTAFVGLDWKCKALYDGAVRVTSAAQANVVLIRARAQDLCSFFDRGELNEIWIFHPEPCDRPAEVKNRLVNATFLQHARHALSEGPDARLILKTDHAEYFAGVLILLGASTLAGDAPNPPFRVVVRSTDYWNDPRALAATSHRPFAGETTGYEARFRKKRQPIYYLELRPSVFST